ncbi:MAG TPA: HAD family phosphatase [Tepidisphaeraceae bacterium]|nr:HAD family phosphatase [Tepidisphaeraceae bacterium]
MTAPCINTVIFDWGGVLIDDPAPLLLSILSRTLGVSTEQFVAAIHHHVEAFQKGLCSESELWNRMCAELGVLTPRLSSLWGSAFRESYHPKQAVWSLARSLKRQGYKIGLLSNTELPGVEYFHASQPHIFDALIFSCCEHCRKPEPAIYQVALNRLQAQPAQTLFIDDRIPYLQGAQAVGLHTLHFQTPKTLIRDLACFGITPE